MGAILALLFLWLFTGAIVAVIMELSVWSPEADGSLGSRILILWLFPFVSLLAALGQFSGTDLKWAAKYILAGKRS